MISEWWAALSPIMKVLWAITLSASLVFVIQSVMTFLGLGGDTDLDASVDTDFSGDVNYDAEPAMNLYTFRNLVNFLLGFGWTAILLKDTVASVPVLLLISLLVGAALVTAVMFLFKWLSGMQESGNIDVLKSASGCQGKVYLTVPGQRSGSGKVQISINNAIREYAAVTEGDTLPTGSQIVVVEAIDSDTLLVESVESMIV